MDTRLEEGFSKERTRRPVRNKRLNRKIYGEEKRPPKRLFTPEIKRYLKDWLVRRRDNPYPNREEKKLLAVQTGLTYIQVCNWFANWRRKLKNSGKEPQCRTWGDLIKTYNNQVHGNVEHFSICSEDSIWYESENDLYTEKESNHYNDNVYDNNNDQELINQCYLVSSTTETNLDFGPFAQSSSKYKNHIMEKYLRDCQQTEQREILDMSSPSVISKWLESAANFRPSESSYLDVKLFQDQKKKLPKTNLREDLEKLKIHGKEELDAAEALTTLANSNRNKTK
ncbi:hypothetical protein HHI36_004456 [Cryptolaemus montrouzieri]|uniref:Homeobox domain-containing protein n=1 Tax=Cryptolaemus montrouzieri TaxID=559131 RepID=A0ABD2NR88_9CUCU